MKKLAALFFPLLVACGGGKPSDLAPYEIGLVGVYTLDSFEDDGEFYDNRFDGRWTGELWLWDNNESHRIFIMEDERYDNVWSNWSATLTTITFEDTTGIYSTSKMNGIGVDIGDMLTIEKVDSITGRWRTDNWLKIDYIPRGLPQH